MKPLRKILKYGLYALGFCLITSMLWSGFDGFQRRLILNQRIADVRALTAAYHELPSSTNIGDLIGVLAQKNIKLNNPIPKDPANPCYFLASKMDANSDEASPSSPLIEETNVTDGHLIVVSCLDGSVVVLRRTNGNQ
jgi:hypothetical protein